MKLEVALDLLKLNFLVYKWVRSTPNTTDLGEGFFHQAVEGGACMHEGLIQEHEVGYN